MILSDFSYFILKPFSFNNLIFSLDFITSNKGKIAALKRSFLNAGRFDIKVNQVQADIVEPQLNNIADVSKYKAMEAFKILKKPILVEDGGLVIEALNGFPGPYTKYVLSTIGIDGILKLMNGENNRAAKFVSFATFVGNDGTVCQFERFGDNFEIAYERKNVIHPDAWSDLWQVMYMKDYGKMLCEFSKQELSDFTERSQTSGSLQQFAKWFLEKY